MDSKQDSKNESKRFYTGVGSRSADIDALRKISYIASILKDKYWCRTGDADGCDTAFRQTAGESALVYKGGMRVCETALEVVELVHPHGQRMSYKTMVLMARNLYQLLGVGLKKPSEFVVCWTSDGDEDGFQEGQYSTTGTGFTITLARKLPYICQTLDIRLAKGFEYKPIEVYNLGKKGRFKDLVERIRDGK